MKDKTVCIVGLGYVGLPLAVSMTKQWKVIGFDIDKKRVEELQASVDNTHEVATSDIKNADIEFSTNPKILHSAEFIIIAVPTPITRSHRPDLTYVRDATRIVAEHMKRGATVVYESTVYPGVTEDICIPLLEKGSGMRCGKDFFVGYSPERVNPGDKAHSVANTPKLVSGFDKKSLDKVIALYKPVIGGGVFPTSCIKVAEAAKVIENTQRDLNIALVNELSLIFDRMNLNTREVLEAASTKWNFHRYSPGLVGGHCISVDPHYLLYKAEMMGYHPKVILAGREVNDTMATHVAEMTIKGLISCNKVVRACKVLVLGLTFKENVTDTRNTKVLDVIKEIQSYGVEVYAWDPNLTPRVIQEQFGVHLFNTKSHERFDGIILAVLHDEFKKLSLDRLRTLAAKNPVLIDVKSIYNGKDATRKGFWYRCL